MELGTTDPVMGDKKTFIFYPSIPEKNLSWLITISTW